MKTTALISLLLAVGCSKATAPIAVAAAAAPPAPAAPKITDEQELALADGTGDIAAIKTELGQLSPAYRCDRLGVAVRTIAREADERYQRMVADAESVCGFQAPLAWAESKLTNIEGMKQSASPKQVQEECGEVRAMFGRVAYKFRTATRLKEASDRFKAVCKRG